MRAPAELGTNTSSAHARRIEWTPVLDREGRKRAFVLRRGLTALLCQRTEVLLPTRRHVLLGRAVVVCGREERSCALDGDQDDRPDAFFPRIEATRRQQLQSVLVELVAALHERCFALEAIAPAQDRIDDVDLDRGVRAKIRDRPRRADIREREVLVVPHGCRPFRRQVWRPVRADGGREAEPLLEDHPLHIRGESHRPRGTQGVPSRRLREFTLRTDATVEVV
jgi:hypothetical protein